MDGWSLSSLLVIFDFIWKKSRKAGFPVKKTGMFPTWLIWLNDKPEFSNFRWLYFNFQQWNVTDRRERWVFSFTKNSSFFFPLPSAGCWIVTPLLHQWHSYSAAALPITWSFAAFSYYYYFFYSSLFHLSSFLLLYFCLSPGWLKWVSRRLCCVVFDSSLGAKLSLTQLLGPTVFLKSVSINIIMACSRHHWIFYCNVQQNITPTLSATQKVLLSDRNFLFWLKGLWEVCFIRRSFCVFVVFSFLCFRKSARPPFDKATEGILFLVRHLLLTLSRNRPRCATRSLCRIWLCTCHLRKIMLFSLAG